MYITIFAAIALVGAPSEMKASCNSGREVIVGQLPDIFFMPGQTTRKDIDFFYKNMPSNLDQCGIYAESTLPGVAVINTYGEQGHEAFPPQVTGIGVSNTAPLTSGILRIEASATAPAGSGTINIYQRTCGDICSGVIPGSNTFDQYYPDKLMLIGKVNVYVTSQKYATTLVATKQASPIQIPPPNNFPNPGTASPPLINNPATNFNPDARLILTPNWNPGGYSGVYNNHPTGVYYGAGRGLWGVSNEDSGQMSVGASFNVRIGGEASFNYQSNVSNSTADWMVIDNPITNDNPNAILFVTHNAPNGLTGMTHNHTLGVWYTGSRWAIFNEDASAMPSGLTFSVQAFGYPDPNGGLFVHTATASNTGYNETWIDNPLTNNNPNATILVTPNFNPGGHGYTTYVDAPIGVYYNSFLSKWAIFTQSRTIMPIGASFNVLVPVSPIY